MLAGLIDTRHLVWIGFSFADQRVTAILREVSEWSGTKVSRGKAPRHVVLMPWYPAHGAAAAPFEPDVVRSVTETKYGARPVLYPVREADHSALLTLLEWFTDPRFAGPPVSPAEVAAPGTPDTGTRDEIWLRPDDMPSAGLASPATATVRVGRSSWRAAYASATRLRDAEHERQVTSETQGRLQRALVAEAVGELTRRQDAVDRSLASLSRRTRSFESRTGLPRRGADRRFGCLRKGWVS